MKSSSRYLIQYVGKIIHNQHGEPMGRVADITETSREEPQYIIVSNDHFSGEGSRYFAIPVSSVFIEIRKKNSLILKAEKNDLESAKGIDFDHCLSGRKKDMLHTIHEVYGYYAPSFRGR